MANEKVVIYVRTRKGEKNFELGDKRFASLCAGSLLSENGQVRLRFYRKGRFYSRIEAYYQPAYGFMGASSIMGFVGRYGKQGEIRASDFQNGDRILVSHVTGRRPIPLTEHLLNWLGR